MFRIEYPIGQARYESGNAATHLRIAPRGGLIAFLEHAPRLGQLRLTLPRYWTPCPVNWNGTAAGTADAAATASASRHRSRA